MDALMSGILVLSSHTRPNTTAPINHALYCKKYGYDYLFDATPYSLKSPVDQKIHSALNALKRSTCDWIFWIDDDAYFVDFDIPLDRFLPADPAVDFIFCKSPVNPQGLWTMINAGIYFVRNSPSAIALLSDVLAVDRKAVQAAWNPEMYGHYVSPGSDQARFTHLFVTRDMIGKSVQILDFSAFNSRVYHFHKSYDEHFICHLAASQDKYGQLSEMRTKFDLDQYLLPSNSGLYDPVEFKSSVFSNVPKPAPVSVADRMKKLSARIKAKLKRHLAGAR
jgi:hypothetical protein